MSATVPYFVLNNGRRIPSVGIGAWMGGWGDDFNKIAYDMVIKALRSGYRHVDTAFGYGNEESVGKAIRDSGVPRNEIFVTTKLIQSDHGTVREGFERSLKLLDIEYIDLYLMHWPQANTKDGRVLRPNESPTYVETWLEIEKLLETGKVKSIGVSNFSIKTLDVLLPQANVVPAVNQVELHPYLPQHDLLKYCNEKSIHLTAYSPLGQPQSDFMPLLKDDVIKEIAQRTGASVGQVLLTWGVQRGTSIVPKSEKEERIKRNIQLVELADADIKLLDELHLQPGKHRSLLPFHSDGGINGWTYEQLGWNMSGYGIVRP